jgi:septation ring formation regulator EzrA
MNKKLNEQISDIKEEINDLIHGIEEEGRTGADICKQLKNINKILDRIRESED